MTQIIQKLALPQLDLQSRCLVRLHFYPPTLSMKIFWKLIMIISEGPVHYVHLKHQTAPTSLPLLAMLSSPGAVCFKFLG